ASEKAIDAASNADAVNQAVADGTTKIQNDYKPGQSLDDQMTAAKANLDSEATKVKDAIAHDDTLTSAEKAAQSATVDAEKNFDQAKIDNGNSADEINAAYDQGIKDIDGQRKLGKSLDEKKAAAKANLDAEAVKVKKAIENDKTLTKADKARQVKNVNRVKAEEQAKIDRENNADGIAKAYQQGVVKIKAQHVKKHNNAGKPKKKFTPRRVYMVKGFYRYSTATFYKKNRVKGYKKHGRPNAVMFTIVGEAKSKHGLKRYKVYQIVSKKQGLFRVDHKKWGYITAKPSYMRPLYYIKNVHKVKVIGKGLRVYKNNKLSKYVKSYKRGTVLKVKAVKKLGTTYRLQLSDGRYVSSNKNLVKIIK
ncbi:DUF5776 domain-containing protein, partial [Apilactobacillus kunkeei]